MIINIKQIINYIIGILSYKNKWIYRNENNLL